MYQALPMALASLLTQAICKRMGIIQLAYKLDAWQLFAITMRAHAICIQASVLILFLSEVVSTKPRIVACLIAEDC